MAQPSRTDRGSSATAAGPLRLLVLPWAPSVVPDEALTLSYDPMHPIPPSPSIQTASRIHDALNSRWFQVESIIDAHPVTNSDGRRHVKCGSRMRTVIETDHAKAVAKRRKKAAGAKPAPAAAASATGEASDVAAMAPAPARATAATGAAPEKTRKRQKPEADVYEYLCSCCDAYHTLNGTGKKRGLLRAHGPRPDGCPGGLKRPRDPETRRLRAHKGSKTAATEAV